MKARHYYLLSINNQPVQELTRAHCQRGNTLGRLHPHWSSSYPEYLNQNQTPEEQQSIVWSRLRNHRAIVAKRLLREKEHYLAARRELNPRSTQVESSHEPLSRDIKSNLTTASRAEKVFKEGVPIN